VKFNTLNEWLHWQESLHTSEIELGLTRVREVLEKLLPELFSENGQQHLPFTLITIGGTNGKGSTVAILEAILRASGYKTGSFTSPHFLQYNERIRLNGQSCDDARVCLSFEAINQARGETSLTYFEFSTLAAIYLFVQAKCDVILLEVGLGGRLDATNILDADCSLVTTVDLDHQDWLGNDIESIAYEKAGIYRSQKAAIFGDLHLPESLKKHAEKISARLIHLGRDYQYTEHAGSWEWHSDILNCHFNQLAKPQLAGTLQLKNAANALMALSCLNQQLPRVNSKTINQGLQNSFLTGRYQKVNTKPDVLLDVAHNPQAAKNLAEYLAATPCQGKTHAIFAMLADKDIERVVQALNEQVHTWQLFELNVPRSLSMEKMKNIVSGYTKTNQLTCYNDFSLAYQSIVENMSSLEKQQDRIIVFGSFFTVSSALRYFSC